MQRRNEGINIEATFAIRLTSFILSALLQKQGMPYPRAAPLARTTRGPALRFQGRAAVRPQLQKG